MKHVVAIDIGGSAVKYAVVNLNGELSGNGKITTNNDDLAVFYEDIKGLVSKLKTDETIGIAISSPGSVNSNTKFIHGLSAVPCIHENDWVLRLGNDMNLPVSILNDANAALMAEVWLGNAKGSSSSASVVLGTGVGGALYLNGALVLGHNLYGGEFGYCLNDVDGKLLSISDLVSTNALAKMMHKHFPDVTNGLEAMDLVDQKEMKALEVIDKYYYNLAIYIYNLVHTVDPEIVLIGGAISNRSDLITNLVSKLEEIKAQANMSDITFNVDICMFKNDANIIGATKFFLDQNNIIK